MHNKAHGMFLFNTATKHPYDLRVLQMKDHFIPRRSCLKKIRLKTLRSRTDVDMCHLLLAKGLINILRSEICEIWQACNYASA